MRMTKDEIDVVEPVRESSDTSSETNVPFPLEVQPSLALGDRVRMSVLGRARHPKHGDLQGLVVGRGSPSSWRVKFDERKCIQAIHRAYLERVVSAAGSSDPSDIGDSSKCVADPA
jgi:hypothetical protein